MLLALAELEADTCSGCGGRLSETLWDEKKQEPRFDVGHLHCLQCAALQKAQDKQHERDEAERKKKNPVHDRARRWVAYIIRR